MAKNTQGGQERTGHIAEPSTNPGTKKGPEGREGAQQKTGHLADESVSKGGKKTPQPDDGLIPNALADIRRTTPVDVETISTTDRVREIR